jgi:hypothetical protein
MLASLKMVADFSRGCVGRAHHLLFATLPHCYVRFEVLETAPYCRRL